MLTSLHVQHYKSLADVRVEFSPITVLVGSNGSGKSNVIDALRFLQNAMRHGLDHAINDRNGIAVLRQYSSTRPYMLSIRVDFQNLIAGSESTSDEFYMIKIASTKGDYQVEAEEATWCEEVPEWDDENDKIVSKKVHQKKFRRDQLGNIFIDQEKQKQSVPPDLIAIDIFSPRFGYFYSGGKSIVNRLADMHFTSIYPNILREPSRLDSDRQLKEGCANWASVLKAMRQRKAGEEAVSRVMELMRQHMPELEQVSVKNIGGYLVPQFLVKDKRSGKAHYFDPIQLSDGTLRLFGLLLSLYQVPRRDFLALEESEQMIHPGLLGLLVDAFREVSKHTQLLITTHSPHLLDYFDPEEIRVVSVERGETRVSPIRRSQADTVKQNLMNLSEIMALDGLQPELST